MAGKGLFINPAFFFMTQIRELTARVKAAHTETFGSNPALTVLSPGRINLLGEHVDYNDGFVLPAAIDKYVCLTLSPRTDNQAVLYSMDFSQQHGFDLYGEIKPGEPLWANYFLGIWAQYKELVADGAKGFNLAFSSTIPMGTGLSSSAAVECGFGYILNEFYDLNQSRPQIALAGQKAEHEFAGVKCGIMDQYASVCGREGQVIKLDCRDLSVEYHTADLKDCELILLDSTVKHSHLTSGYNDRRNEVEQGLEILKRRNPGTTSFRDMTEAMMDEARQEMGEVIYRRCLYVVGEIRRVQEAAQALDSGQLETLGKLMFETHDGLSRDYEVSCEEIDFLVDQVRNDANVLGSRMMGGGFGGCAITLVRKSRSESLIKEVASAYKNRFGIELKTYRVALSDGTKLYADSHAIL